MAISRKAPKQEEIEQKASSSEADNQQINIMKIYIHDGSMVVHNVKTIFAGEWVPELKISVNTKSEKLEDDSAYNVMLSVKCDVSSKKSKAFSIEATQCGIFSIPKCDDQTMEHVLGVFCPNVLYPYLREIITDMVMKAGFPQLALAPINFEMMLAQKKDGQVAH